MGGFSSALVIHGLAGLQVMSPFLNSATEKCLFKPELVVIVNFIDNSKVTVLLVRCVVLVPLIPGMPVCVMFTYVIKKSLLH